MRAEMNIREFEKMVKRGFTLVEVMVVIVIMGLLAMVAMPNIFGLIEKTRENIDVLKLFYLRDALNRALVETNEALTNSACIKGAKKEDQDVLINNLNKFLTSETGLTLFVMEIRSDEPPNYQTTHNSANKDNNLYNIGNTKCNLLGSGGTWYNALKEAGFDGVAEVVAFRADTQNDGNIKKYVENDKNQASLASAPYVVKKTGDGKYWRTYPKNSVFISKAMNYGKSKANYRLTMNFQYTGRNAKSRSVEVALIPNQGNMATGAFRTDHGVCFSTLGRSGCSSYVYK